MFLVSFLILVFNEYKPNLTAFMICHFAVQNVRQNIILKKGEMKNLN